MNGAHDLAICFGHLQDSSCKCRKITEFQNFLVASPEFARKNKLTSLGCLNKLPWVTNEKLYRDGAWVLRGGGSERFVITPDIKYGSNSLSVIHKMAILSLGVTLLPSWMVSEDIERRRLLRLFSNYNFASMPMPMPMPVYVLYPNSVRPPLKVRKFIDFLVTKHNGFSPLLGCGQ